MPGIMLTQAANLFSINPLQPVKYIYIIIYILLIWIIEDKYFQRV